LLYQGVQLSCEDSFCVGAKVMLLQNFLVEHKIMNGSVGEVMGICYKIYDEPKIQMDLNVF
jgi:hypothetical protein